MTLGWVQRIGWAFTAVAALLTFVGWYSHNGWATVLSIPCWVMVGACRP